MSDNLLIVTISIVLLLLMLLLVYFLRRNTDIDIQGNIMVLKKPFGNQTIDLEKELDHWSTQQLRLLLWGGIIYGIGIKLKSGKQLTVNSRFNQHTYQRLYQLLDSDFQDKRVSAL